MKIIIGDSVINKRDGLYAVCVLTNNYDYITETYHILPIIEEVGMEKYVSMVAEWIDFSRLLNWSNNSLRDFVNILDKYPHVKETIMGSDSYTEDLPDWPHLPVGETQAPIPRYYVFETLDFEYWVGGVQYELRIIE